MLYTEQQVVAMINLARTNTTTSAEDIMSEMEAVYLPDDDLINDYGMMKPVQMEWTISKKVVSGLNSTSTVESVAPTKSWKDN